MSQLDPARPVLHERAEYKPMYRHEEFIVPLLAGRIVAALDAFAAPAPPGARALDVGCGRQPLRPRLESMGYAYAAMDTQQAPDGSVDFVCPIDAPLPDAVLARGPYDLVVCTEVLEHVADWVAAFTNFTRLLAPGGRILLTCPHFYELHEVPYDFWRPTLFALDHFARRFGLTCLHREAAGDAWDLIGTAVAMSRPVGRSGRIVDRWLASLANVARWGVWVILKTRWIQRHVAIDGRLYLSNVVVLERPREAAAGAS